MASRSSPIRGVAPEGTSACPNGKFYCQNAGHVPVSIFSSRVNDGICDCCDGSDEYDGKVKCTNTCWEAGKASRNRLKKNIKTYKEGLTLRKQDVEQARVALAKDDKELTKLQREEKILKGLVQQLKEQMLAHLCLKFRTDSEGLQQQETLDSLPKAIWSSISHFLFYSLLDKVSEMKPEYFPPKEDVILQNEAPTDFYILVTGAVDLLIMKNGTEQVVGEARTGELCGEIGVLCYRLQLFTVRTKRLSQLLRLNRTTFLNIVQANVGDGTIIMNNLLQGNGTVINQNGLDIEALKTSRLPLSGSAQVGESRAVQVIGSSQAVAVSNDSNHPNMADNETAKVDSYSSGRPPVGPGSSSHDIFQGSIPHRSGKSFDHKSPSSLDTRSANSQSQERREAGNWEKQAVQSDSKKGVELS